MDDRDLVALQLGREPRAFRRVAARCPHGAPAVTEQEPYDRDGAPFPTMYYLTCRTLVAAVSRVEAAGGVERLTELLARDDPLRDDHVRATEQQRLIRRGLAPSVSPVDGGASLDTGIGGSRNPAQLKCLHAHAAFALAWPGYLLGERVLAEVEEREGALWPAQCCLAYPTPL
jgi:uncharacterized protein